MLLASRAGEVEVIALDAGPGIADLPRHMRDGFSTGGTPGTGLGAVQRLSQEFDMHSQAGEGTVVLARIRGEAARPAASPIVVAGISTCAPGEVVCGDSWAASIEGECVTLLVADGLGHGKPAEEASQTMVQGFAERTSLPLCDLLNASHDHLRSTRGAAAAFYRIDAARRTVQCCGAGNVLARIVSGVSDRTLLTQHGTVGVQMRAPHETNNELPPHAVVVAHSDGIESRWKPQHIVPALVRDPAIIAALVWRDHCRGRDDATVVVVAHRGAA